MAFGRTCTVGLSSLHNWVACVATTAVTAVCDRPGQGPAETLELAVSTLVHFIALFEVDEKQICTATGSTATAGVFPCPLACPLVPSSAREAAI